MKKNRPLNQLFIRASWTLLCALASTAMAKGYHVSTTGNDSNDGSKDFPLLTIQRAADLAQPGDVITVHEGTYRERINPPGGAYAMTLQEVKLLQDNEVE